MKGSFAGRRECLYSAAAVTVGGLALTLPGLGSFGLWEPGELAVAERAAAFVRGSGAGSLCDGVAGSPPLRALWPTLGMRAFGVSELTARLPVALLAVATLLAVLWLGAGLFRVRVGLLAAAILACFPLFVLEARQLTSDIPAMAALTLAIGGLGRFALAGKDRRARIVALGVAGIGLVVGALVAGTLVGVAAPLGAFAAAVLVAGRHDERRDRIAATLAAVASGALVLAAFSTPHLEGRMSWQLGGVVKVAPVTQSFMGVVRTLGFGLFPFGVVALFALVKPLAALETADEGASPATARTRFSGLLLLFAATFEVALATVQLRLTGSARLAVVPLVALAIAAFLSDFVLRSDPADHATPALNPLLGVLLAAGAMLVARDLSLAPEELASVHLNAAVLWPTTVSLSSTLLVVGALSALGLLLTQVRATWSPQARSITLALVLAPPALFGLFVAHSLVPTLSRHLSMKRLLDRHRALATDDRPLLLYRVAREGSGVFDQLRSEDIASGGVLVADLQRHPGDFALVARGELAAIDDAFAGAGVSYAVADDSSSRTLLLTGRLPAGVTDVNPLRRDVWRGGGDARPPWPAPRVTVASTFGDAVELIGADFPASVRRPGGFTLTLYFRVLKRPPPDYKIFVHVERPNEALIPGDHPPLGGAYPTAHWRPGDFIRDTHEITVPLVTSPAGVYDIAVGLWPGGDTVKRLAVTAGAQDGHDRVRLGTIRVQ